MPYRKPPAHVIVEGRCLPLCAACYEAGNLSLPQKSPATTKITEQTTEAATDPSCGDLKQGFRHLLPGTRHVPSPPPEPVRLVHPNKLAAAKARYRVFQEISKFHRGPAQDPSSPCRHTTSRTSAGISPHFKRPDGCCCSSRILKALPHTWYVANDSSKQAKHHQEQRYLKNKGRR